MKTEVVRIIISAVFIIIVYPSVRFILYKLIDNVAKFNLYDNVRARMIKKTFNILILITLVPILVSIWGVDPKNILIALSSVFAIVGVALFAQWSILSNVTAGIVIFFSLQIKIGDRIKIHDKDFPIEAIVKDIRTFYIYLETENGEKMTYPNNLILQKGISVSQPHLDVPHEVQVKHPS